MDQGNQQLILVVDDERDVRDALREALELFGYRVSTATDGAEALDEIGIERPAAVICDVSMPVMDGLQFLAALRADPSLRHVPVIMLTALAADTDIVRGVQAGASMYLTKPVRTERLLSLLAGMVPKG